MKYLFHQCSNSSRCVGQPEGITNHSKALYLVTHNVVGSFPASMLTWLYPLQRTTILMKYLESKFFELFSNERDGYFFFIVTLLSTRHSMYKGADPCWVQGINLNTKKIHDICKVNFLYFCRCIYFEPPQ